MNSRIRAITARITSALLLGTALAGCSSFGPDPWEKDLMAKKPMLLDAYALEKGAVDHIAFSKEASSGGRGFAGGGCGCN